MLLVEREGGVDGRVGLQAERVPASRRAGEAVGSSGRSDNSEGQWHFSFGASASGRHWAAEAGEKVEEEGKD